LKPLQRNIDIVPLDANLSRYRIVAAPNLRLIDDAVAAKLESYVADGGVLILSPRSGTQNLDCSMRRVVSPGVFAEIAGVSVDSKLDLSEYSSARGQMDSAHESALGIAFAGNDAMFRPRLLMESLVLHGAETVARFRGGRMEGRPAVVRNRYKQGWVIYQGTDSADHGFHEAVARLAADAAGLRPLIDVPRGVVVTTREDDQHVYTFLLNLTETPHSDIHLPRAMHDYLNGDRKVQSISLEPLGIAVLAGVMERVS
jgi:beta-galactosidase